MSERIQFRVPDETFDDYIKISEKNGFKSVGVMAKHALNLFLSEKYPELVDLAMGTWRYKEVIWLNSVMKNMKKHDITGIYAEQLLKISGSQIEHKIKYYRRIKEIELIAVATETMHTIRKHLQMLKRIKGYPDSQSDAPRK